MGMGVYDEAGQVITFEFPPAVLTVAGMFLIQMTKKPNKVPIYKA